MGNKSGYFSLVILLASVASAQDRTFLFTVTPQITEARNILVHYDAGYAERAFRPFGEDLEGFWEEEEAEGGAKLLIGPSLHVASGKSRWQFTIGGGAIFYATKSNRDSGAP